MNIRQGDFLWLKNEPDQIYKVIESNGDRLIVSPTKWNYEIIPQETIHVSDIEYILRDGRVYPFTGKG